MDEVDNQTDYVSAPQHGHEDEMTADIPPVQSLGNDGATHTIGGFIVDDEDEEEEYTPTLDDHQPSDVHQQDGVQQPNDVQPQDGSAVVEGLQDVVENNEGGQLLEEVSTSNDLPTTPNGEAYAAPSPLKQEQDDFAPDDSGQTDSASYDPTVPSANGATADHPEHASLVEPSQSPSSSVQATALMGGDFASTVPKARLPHDHVGILEDRIKEDPVGDTDAWITLINEYKRRNKLDEARAAYDRFLKIFPTAAEQWVAWVEMELELSDWTRTEKIFSRALLSVLNLQLWSTYLNYVRRRYVVSTDKTGNARKVVTETYEFVLQTIGHDKDSGHIWQDYVNFIRSSPEQVGGTTWQDQQKMDTLRKVYQKAICVPTQAVGSLWKEYDAFEMGINKQTGRKFLQEKSPSYMTARSANAALQNITQDLRRNTVPKLPPVAGFEGDVDYMQQVQLWQRWIEWEKDDPLVLKEEDEEAFKGRITYTYKQAVMTLRFWPEIWCNAAHFCFSNGMDAEGDRFLEQGIIANPESCLLAFKQAERVESTTAKGQTEESIRERGEKVKAPYDKVLEALYSHDKKLREREQAIEARIRESAPKPEISQDDNELQDEEEDSRGPVQEQSHVEAQVVAMKTGFATQLRTLSKTITFAWIALMRAMRRVQGKGGLGATVGGSRQVFADGRKRGRLTSDYYVANAMIEYHCYQDPVATKIMDKGAKLYQDDDYIALEYIKHLININDTTNARAFFETKITWFLGKALVSKTKPLFQFMHDYESRYGELSQVSKLEGRMRELSPEDPLLKLFAGRFSNSDFDPTSVRPLISPATQARPKALTIPTLIEHRPISAQHSPRPSIASVTAAPQITLSPKRPLEDSDNDSARASKIPRSESPLKGAAGRRLAANRSQLRQELQQNGSDSGTPMPLHVAPPPIPVAPPMPPELHRLLTLMPRAESYNAQQFNAGRMVDLLRSIDLSRAQLHRPGPGQMQMPQLPAQHPFQQNSQFGYPR